MGRWGQERLPGEDDRGDGAGELKSHSEQENMEEAPRCRCVAWWLKAGHWNTEEEHGNYRANLFQAVHEMAQDRRSL